MDQNVFAKYTVLDFTRGDFGAVCSEYLGLYGMNVIRVEVPGSRDHDNEYPYKESQQEGRHPRSRGQKRQGDALDPHRKGRHLR